jgi:hypothetical protein
MVISLKRWISLCIGFILLFPLVAQTGFEEGRYPSIPKAIRANILSDRKSALVNWEPPKDEGEIIIARSNTVIDTAEKLYIADSLGRYRSGGAGGTKNYYDYNLKPGIYYYAVALVSDVRKREVKLFANQNFTNIPVIIEETSSSPEVGVNPQLPIFEPESNHAGTVSNIAVSLEKKNVRIDWRAPPTAVSGRTIYTIYRSTNPLTTLPLLQKAVKLAEVGHPAVTFLDQGLEKSQTLYYGVSVKEGKGAEALPLEDKKSTIRIFYVKNTDTNTAEVIPDDSSPASEQRVKPTVVAPIDAPGTMHVRGVGYERVGKGVVMSWLPPEGADDSVIYSVYASTKSLSQGTTSFGSGFVVKVASINHPKTNFYIKELKEIEDLYFGITAKSGSIAEDYNLKENVSFFKFDFGKDLSVPTETEVADVKPNKIDKVEKPEDLKIVNQSGVIPAELNSLVEEDGDDIHSDSTTVGFNVSEEELNRIIRETVLRKKFESGAYRLEKFLTHERNSHLLGKAYFYLAVSYLKSGETRKALRFFMKRETKSFSPDRTEFWTNQTLEKMGRGKV